MEARCFYCAEEIRLNRRLAPKIYLDVISIGDDTEALELDAQPAIEYAVRMRRFASARQMDRRLANSKILPRHLDSLAAMLVRFHGGLSAAETGSARANVMNSTTATAKAVGICVFECPCGAINMYRKIFRACP